MQTEDSPVTDHRTRLLQGLAQSVATKGYADTTIADAILDRIVHRSHRLELNGESLRKDPPTAAATSATPQPARATKTQRIQ